MGPGKSAPKIKNISENTKRHGIGLFAFTWVVLIHYLEQGKAISEEYFAALLNGLQDMIKPKRPHLDSVPAHKSKVVDAKLHHLRFEMLLYVPQ